jgi:hypothetical protein
VAEPVAEEPRPPSDIIRLIKKELARDLFGSSDIAPLEDGAQEKRPS